MLTLYVASEFVWSKLIAQASIHNSTDVRLCSIKWGVQIATLIRFFFAHSKQEQSLLMSEMFNDSEGVLVGIS